MATNHLNIDERIKIPVTNLWNQADAFAAELVDEKIVIRPMIPELT